MAATLLTLFGNRSVRFEVADVAHSEAGLRKAMTWRIRAVLPLLILIIAGLVPFFAHSRDAYSRINIRLTETNNGSTIYTVVGTNLNVFLKVSPPEIFKSSCLWSKITSSSDATLQEVQKYVFLPTGVTAAFFRAVKPGAVQLRSYRYDCSKESMVEWRVDVRVTQSCTAAVYSAAAARGMRPRCRDAANKE
jgi:hypothetical protein